MSFANSGVKPITRTATQLYRDCLRLVQHIAGKSRKGQQLKVIVGKEFRKNAKIVDSAAVEALKANAIRALANYLMLESATKDDKLRNRTASFVEQEASSLRKEK